MPLEFPQKRTPNIIFPGGEHATNLIIETLSHGDSCYTPNSHSFSSDDHEFGGAMAPFRLWIDHCHQLQGAKIARHFHSPQTSAQLFHALSRRSAGDVGFTRQCSAI